MHPFTPAAALAAFTTVVIGLAAPAAARAQAGTAPAVCPALLQQTFPRLQDDKPQSLCQYAGKVLLVA